MNTHTNSLKTFWTWVGEPDSNEGKFHFYQVIFNKDPSILTLPHNTYLCGLKVDDNIDLKDYDWMQMMRSGYEPFENRFCKVCMENYKYTKKLTSQ